MSITVNLYYYGKNGNARLFAEEMERSKTADLIRNENGCLRYEYFFPMNDNECVLLIDSWKDQKAIDLHHSSNMKIERYISDDDIPEKDKSFIRK